VLSAAEIYEKAGASLVRVSLPSIKHALPAYYVISSAEASSNLARFDGIRYGHRSAAPSESIEDFYRNSRSEAFGDEVKRRIMLGTFALSSGYYDAYYKKALQVRTCIANELDSIFEKCDLILAPVAPTVAYKIGEKTANPLELYMGDIYTVPVNIAGIPALSLPCGTNADGLPVGMQLLGKHFSEPLLYRAGFAFEALSGISHAKFKTV
jgi:aspartyl-tRNA(Asn)/glutamyl-tRNA(Gln) amidotransferase subunit A